MISEIWTYSPSLCFRGHLPKNRHIAFSTSAIATSCAKVSGMLVCGRPRKVLPEKNKRKNKSIACADYNYHIDVSLWLKLKRATIKARIIAVYMTSSIVRTRTVQPVVTCRQSPNVHKPAIVKLLLLIYSFQFRSAFRATTTPIQPRPLPSPTHKRHRYS